MASMFLLFTMNSCLYKTNLQLIGKYEGVWIDLLLNNSLYTGLHVLCYSSVLLFHFFLCILSNFAGRVRVIKAGESMNSASIDELRKLLLFTCFLSDFYHPLFSLPGAISFLVYSSSNILYTTCFVSVACRWRIILGKSSSKLHQHKLSSCVRWGVLK